MTKKHAMRVWVEKVKEGDGPIACQMCGIGKSEGRYLVKVQLPFRAMGVDKELRLGIQCASNFLHISRNGIEAWATPKPKWIEIG